jgi:cyanophycinase
MKTPQGKLIPIGGNEAKTPDAGRTDSPVDFFRSGILKEVLTEMRGTGSRIEVIPAASSIPDEMGPMYLDAFRILGCTDVGVLDIRDRSQTDHPDHLRRLDAANGVIFTGGDQSRLVEKLRETAFLRRLRERYEREPFVVAGTSAGAMMMSRFMIQEGTSAEPLRKGLVETGTGLGFLPQAIIDTHFMNRGRLARLTEALLRCPGCVALGLSEDTGLVVSEGTTLRAIGSGVVVVIEADEVRATNYHEAKESDPVFIENLRLHLLARGASYSLKEKRFVEATIA